MEPISSMLPVALTPEPPVTVKPPEPEIKPETVSVFWMITSPVNVDFGELKVIELEAFTTASVQLTVIVSGTVIVPVLRL